jgi:hypothetical protein
MQEDYYNRKSRENSFTIFVLAMIGLALCLICAIVK